MPKPFKKVPDQERRTIRYPVHLNTKEDEAIRASAKFRNLSVGEYFRRTALGRKADVHYETQVIRKLSEFIATIRKVYADLAEAGRLPPEIEEWRPLIQDASEAIARISK